MSYVIIKLGLFPIWQHPYSHCLMASHVQHADVMYGRILSQLRESKGRAQAEVARSVGISPAQLARLEANQRGLYVEDFVSIAEALGEKPGNLLTNDLGSIGHLKPLIDRLLALKPEFLTRVTAIIGKIVLLTEDVTMATRLPQAQVVKPRSKSPSPAKRKRRP
jgi:transcriptional regulator with XRE-family HTH domain